ncbi:hypothetical protein ACMD2_06044, partial [Ananas comosus]
EFVLPLNVVGILGLVMEVEVVCIVGVSLAANVQVVLMVMPNYYKDHGEMTSPKSNWNHSTFEEQSDGSTLFSSPNYAYEKHYYEQPQSIQLEPFKPSWSINNSLNIFEDGIFHKSSWDDESYSKNDDHFFPFQKYSE